MVKTPPVKKEIAIPLRFKTLFGPFLCCKKVTFYMDINVYCLPVLIPSFWSVWATLSVPSFRSVWTTSFVPLFWSVFGPLFGPPHSTFILFLYLFIYSITKWLKMYNSSLQKALFNLFMLRCRRPGWCWSGCCRRQGCCWSYCRKCGWCWSWCSKACFGCS